MSDVNIIREINYKYYFYKRYIILVKLIRIITIYNWKNSRSEVILLIVWLRFFMHACNMHKGSNSSGAVNQVD